MPEFRYKLEENAPVAHTTAKPRKAMQFADIALKRILLLFRQSGQTRMRVL
jgi:hypothetical protein